MAETITKKILPTQSQNTNFSFVKLRGMSKKPFEEKWTKQPYVYKEIQSWIDEGCNYGVLGGHGGLIVIDADTPEIDKVVKDKLPQILTVKTPRCGHHYYYNSKG